MIPLPGRDDAVAERLDDWASGLDAGLSVRQMAETAGVERARTDAGAAAALADALQLQPAERAALEAAERAGRLPDALRRAADARRRRAALVRDLLAGVRYPLLVLLVAAVVFGLGGVATGGGWAELAPFGVLAALVAAGALVFRRAGRDPGFSGARMPGLGRLLQDWGEVPYLQALAALYGAGVPIARAHREALRTVPVARVRARLFAAADALDAGEPLAETLRQGAALHPETLELLAHGELAGTLESALERAAERRRFSLRARTGRAVRLVAFLLYAAVALWVALRVVGFYSNLYALPGLR